MSHILKSLILISIIVGTPVAFACPGEKHGHKQCDHKDGQCPYHNKKSWSEKLNLEGDQAKQVDALEVQFKEERKKLKEEHRSAMSDLKAEQNTALGEFLSPEQIAQLGHSHGKKHHKDEGGHWEHKNHKQCPHKKAGEE